MELVQLRDLKVVLQLGKGTYGVVNLARHRKTHDLYAIKENFVSDEEREQGIPPSTLRELALLKSLDHPNVIQLCNADFSNEAVKLILPYRRADLGQLMYTPRSDDDYHIDWPHEPEFVQELAQQLLSGVKYLHEHNVIHRDIKPANLLLDFETIACTKDVDTKQEMLLQIADFGLARVIAAEYANDNRYSRDVCTVWYRAPEILLGGAYSFSADIWSVGCILAEIVRGKPLFAGDSTEFDQLRHIFQMRGTPSVQNKVWPEATDPKRFPLFSPEMPCWKPQPMTSVLNQNPSTDLVFQHLVSKLLELNPNKRWTAAQALRHPYFSESLLEK